MKAGGYSLMGHAVMFDLGQICLHNECANITDISLLELPLYGPTGRIVAINLDDGLYLMP